MKGVIKRLQTRAKALLCRDNLGLQIGFGNFHQLFERGRVVQGQIRHDLTVQSHLSLFQAGNKIAVGHPILTNGGIKTCDPKPAELPFTGLTVPKGVISGAFGRFPYGTVLAALRPEITLREFKKLLLAFSLRDCSFNTCHVLLRLIKSGSSV